MVDETTLPISRLQVELRRHDLRRMLRLVKLLYRLSGSEVYRQRVFPELPETARFDPGYASLMMGYDFHLGETGPQLIEVNTNAGGWYLAWQSEAAAGGLYGRRLQERLLLSFRQEWQAFSGSNAALQRVAVVDEEPEDQGLYPEMVACCRWLKQMGIAAQIAEPQHLEMAANRVSLEGEPIDLIYNRHCDFYLETPETAGMRNAYLAGDVCLSPNPFAYGLLADKRRLILWSDPEALKTLDLAESEQQLLLQMVPRCHLLRQYNPEDVWEQRKDLIFKPVNRFGGRGVLMGKSISRKRFSELDPEYTLVQEVVNPSVVSDADGQEFKTDLRLFVYRDRLLGVTARLYQGQVTNLRTEGGGFAPVRLV